MLPRGITNIYEKSFLNCSSIENIIIPSGVKKEKADEEYTTELEADAFRGCSKLKKVIMHSTVTKIGERAFSECSEELIIYGDKDSEAEEYAKRENITFKVYGDINGDGICKSTDALWLSNYLTDKRELTEEQQERADLNADGKVKDSTIDLVRLKWKLVGLE